MTAEARPEVLTIDRLGHLGDGIAATDRGQVFVPMTLPGERVEVRYEGADRNRARAIRILEDSPDRTAPICRHFGDCGGCVLQHMAGPAYLDWKRDQVRHALGHRGLDAEVDPTVPIGPGTRRRAVFAARREKGRIRFGYHARQSHRIVEISECPILVPEIAGALDGLARLAAPLVPPKGELRVAVTATLTGLDVAIDGPKLRPADLPASAAAAVQELDIARLSVAGETALQMAEPAVGLEGSALERIEVAVPPGAFLQAVAQAEATMARLVCEGVGKADRVADLYAGIGTFALRLARTARVLAVEGDQAALVTLALAARRARGLKPVTTLKRDLARMPVTAGELAGFRAAVFDPPRAGAAAQAAELAGSRLPRIVAVSCNPATLARDLRILVDGGYRIDRVTPVDQFLFSPHIEVVAQLSRG
ncbi:class I SAM-dependent RNA methyltransferase [Microbaculum marinum]|uniref:Class I SAM-dependent RNA methyltransferase n=1 Tax=Microbaculum marinum TaxID=1764581 RepID=A0AAW9RN45_9HYPH